MGGRLCFSPVHAPSPTTLLLSKISLCGFHLVPMRDIRSQERREVGSVGGGGSFAIANAMSSENRGRGSWEKRGQGKTEAAGRTKRGEQTAPINSSGIRWLLEGVQ